MSMPIIVCRPVRFKLAVILTTLVISAGALPQIPNAASAKFADAGPDDFYRLDEVQSIHLRVAEDDLQRMRAALPKRISVQASFRWRDISVENVAIRFKGDSSSGPTQQHKRSFLIKFNEYADDQRFLGLRRVSFDNGVQFGSVFSETIITEILRDQRITTHRCNYAKLFLNGEYQGVYVNVERIDESFIEHHLPDSNGLLFKVDEGGPGANLQFLGDDPSAYARAFEPQTNSAKREQHRLVEFIRMINQSKPSEFAANLDSRFETDDFLRVTAVMLFSGAFDQLTGWNPHNYYLYYDGKHDRWRYLPWDLDVGFSAVAFGRIQVLADWNAAWPVAGQMPNPLLERIVADPVLLQRYRDTAQIILDKYFEPERLCEIIDARYTLIKEDLLADPFPHRRVTNPEDQSYDDIVASMKEFVRNRYASARQQLRNPGQRPQIVRRKHGPPPQLAERIQRLQRAAQEMQRNGEDVRPIHKLMQQVGPLLQQGRADEAERLIAEALTLADEGPGRGNKESPRDERKLRPSPDSGL
jgi:spore coat protein H